MLTVYGRATSSNVQPVMWTIAELGLKVDRIDRGGQYGGLDTDQFYALNPHRKVPAVQSALEPALPLFACAVGECMGLHALSGIALQGIIANLRSRIHCLGDVAAFQTAELFLCSARPDP